MSSFTGLFKEGKNDTTVLFEVLGNRGKAFLITDSLADMRHIRRGFSRVQRVADTVDAWFIVDKRECRTKSIV